NANGVVFAATGQSTVIWAEANTINPTLVALQPSHFAIRRQIADHHSVLAVRAPRHVAAIRAEAEFHAKSGSSIGLAHNHGFGSRNQVPNAHSSVVRTAREMSPIVKKIHTL